MGQIDGINSILCLLIEGEGNSAQKGAKIAVEDCIKKNTVLMPFFLQNI